MSDLILLCTSIVVSAIWTNSALRDSNADSTNFPSVLMYAVAITTVVSIALFLFLKLFVYQFLIA